MFASKISAATPVILCADLAGEFGLTDQLAVCNPTLCVAYYR